MCDVDPIWPNKRSAIAGRRSDHGDVVSARTAFPLDNGISEQRTQLWILARKVNDRVGGRLMISTEFLHRRRLDNLQRGILRECCKRCEFGAARTTGTP